VLFEICNSLFVVFVTQEAMPLEQLKRGMAEQIVLVFAGLRGKNGGSTRRK
jgi:hypothetical protein